MNKLKSNENTSNTLRYYQNYEGRQYPCDQCDYIATQSGHLKTHRESKYVILLHEGLQYPS